MEQTLQQLGGLLLKAVPTIVLLIIVHFYLKVMFFGPLGKVLAERKQATEGTRQKAELLLKKATETAAAVEEQLRKANEEIYQEQEQTRHRWSADQSAQLEQARQHSRELIRKAREQIEAETAAAKRELTATSDGLANEITRIMLERKMA